MYVHPLEASRALRVGQRATLLTIPVAGPAAAGAQQPGIEILVKDVTGTEPVAPGEVFSYQPVIHNSGEVTAEIILLELTDEQYARHTQRFSNCKYSPEGSQAFCEFEINLEPGETAQVPADTAVELKVEPNAPGGYRVNAGYIANGFIGPLTGPEGEFGDGPELRLEKLPDAEFGSGNVSFANVLFDVGPNPLDLAAIGAEIQGDPGETVTVAVGVENHGPADLPGVQAGEGAGEDRAGMVNVTFPEGVTVVKILDPEGDLQFVSSCVPVVDGAPAWDRRDEVDGLNYRCAVSEIALPPGESWLFPFRVEIAGSEEATGQVEVLPAADEPDLDNNVAAVTLTPGEGGTGGGLPVTGAATGLLAGTGALALAAGLGLFLLGRRRRVRLTTDER